MNTGNLKLELMRIVGEIQGDWKIKWLIKVSKLLKITPSKAAFIPPPIIPEKKELAEIETSESLLNLGKVPIPESIDLESLKKEQGYNPKALIKTFENWDYSLFKDDSLEDLLKALTK